MTTTGATLTIDIGELLPYGNAKGSGRFYVNGPFVRYFPPQEFFRYDDFVKMSGKIIKQESGTRVVLVHRRVTDGLESSACGFIIKSHRYPFLRRLRTGFRISKTENEFKSLRRLKQLGVDAVEPVAFGAERTLFRLVRSCFIITRYFDETTTLADWHWANHDKEELAQKAARLKRLGALFLRVHGARFFLFSLKPSNVLLRAGVDNDHTLHVLDTPYARTLRWGPLARWAQSRDVGYCLGSFHPNVTNEDIESFFEGYQPYPFGRSASNVQRRIRHAVRVQQNLTPLAYLVNAVKLDLRRWRRWRRARRALVR
jgi:hypothetical protein